MLTPYRYRKDRVSLHHEFQETMALLPFWNFTVTDGKRKALRIQTEDDVIVLFMFGFFALEAARG